MASDKRTRPSALSKFVESALTENSRTNRSLKAVKGLQKKVKKAPKRLLASRDKPVIDYQSWLDLKRIPPVDTTDLDPTDFDAHIERYESYIEQGHPRAALEPKLAKFRNAQSARRNILMQYEGMDWDTIQRLKILEMIEAKLKENDPCRELKNVEAIIAAYECRELTFGQLTTYWCQGERVGESEGIDWDLFKSLNTKENRGDSGFWVEGIFSTPHSSSQVRRYAGDLPAPNDPNTTVPTITQHVRLDHRLFPTDTTEFPTEFHARFMDDTGADHMSIYEDDMKLIMGDQAETEQAPWDHLMGYTGSEIGDGSIVVEKVIAVEVNILGTDRNENPKFLRDEWASAPCTIMETPDSTVYAPETLRVAGPFLRSCFFVGSVPGYPVRTYASTTKGGLRAPNVEEDEIPMGPPFYIPQHGVTWRYNQLKAQWVPAANLNEEGQKPSNVLEQRNP